MSKWHDMLEHSSSHICTACCLESRRGRGGGGVLDLIMGWGAQPEVKIWTQNYLTELQMEGPNYY